MSSVQPPRDGPADLRLPPVVARMATWPPLAAVALALLAALTFQATLEGLGPWLLVVAVVVGLPHGATDHLLPQWSGLSLRPRQWAVLLAAYVAAASVALVWMLVEPRVALVLLVLAALHFGCGEVAVAALRSGRRPSRARAAAVAVGVGATIVAGPLVRYPAVTDPLLAGINPDVPTAITLDTRVAVLWVGVACGLLGALLAMREGDGTTAVEVVMLIALPLTVPPLMAFAVFFGAWHAPRHTLRLLAEDPRNTADLRVGRLGRPLRRFLVSSAPTTALAAVGVASLAAVAVGGAPALAIGALLALTVPHAVAVGWLDVRLARTLGRTAPPASISDGSGSTWT